MSNQADPHKRRRSSLVVAALFALAVLVAGGCDRGGSGKAVAEEPTSAEKGAAPKADGPDSLGDACETIEDCQSYLSCIEGTCQIPPAVTGRHDSDTPRVTLVDSTGETLASFWVELARTPAEQQKGLMYRRQMQDDWGMLFIYPNEGPLSFWMENTFIPLDMIFVDADGEIVNIVAGAEPLTRVKRRSQGDAQYVLEINAGLAEKLGLEAGQTMRFENIEDGPTPAQ